MERLFTKNATGLAPDGRLYAGDINALQDAAAAANDLTQAIALGILKIGETGLQLLRYGASEARLSGALRTDGILRALGGLYAGAFTSTQRDAIPTGLAPYGLIILNTTTNQYEWNKGNDSARNWQAIAPEITDGSITSAKLASDVSVVPVGGVVDFPWSSGSIPAWSALAYGQAVSATGRVALAALDTASGHPHGVSGGNIVLPDYRGRVGAGKDDMGGASANRITVAVSGINGATLGAVGGAEGVTLTTAQLPAHNHGVTDPGHTHSVKMAGAQSGSAGGFFGPFDPSGDYRPTESASTGISIQNNGSGGAHQNTQPTIIVNKIIRLV